MEVEFALLKKEPTNGLQDACVVKVLGHAKNFYV